VKGVRLSQAPELSGGAGFTFEDRVTATYLAALLQQGFAAGIADRTVCRVALQQRDFGEPLDDVIVDFQTDQRDLARLSLQVKRSLTISSASSNTDFRDVIRDCWSTFNKPDFRRGTDRYGPAVGDVATDKIRDLQTLCELARASTTLAEFEARFAPGGNASATVRQIKNDIASLIERAAGSACSGQDLKDFLAHLVLIKFDFLHEGQTHLPTALNGLRTCLATGEAIQALALWDRLCTLAREGAGRSAVFDRPTLVRSLSAAFRLAAALSFRQDLERLKSLAQQWLADIEDDVAGTRLERATLSAELETKLASSRWIQIRGLPGGGKSVLLRRRVEADIARGPVFFLKSGRLEGTGWPSFATANGLSNASLRDLLVELAATGSSTLYIDGIDRIEKQHQPIILDVIRAVMKDPLLDNWRVVVSLRDTGIEPLRNWLGNVLARTAIGTVEVKALDDEEAALLAKAKPYLRPLLFGPPQVREIVRRPFFAKVLNQNFGSTAGNEAFQPHSEVDLIGNWWARGGYNADGQSALERQRAIVELGAVRARHLERDIAVRELSPSTVGVIEQLVADGILQYVRVGHSLRFSHDIFFEWAFFQVLSDTDDWLNEIRACGEPPAVARVVELLSQWDFGQDDAWAKTLHRVDGSSMRSQWTRAWLLAPLAAPNFKALQVSFSAALEANDHYFLKKALVWFQAERTMPNPMILEGNLPQEERIRLADLMGWPSEIETWSRFIAFLLARISTIPATLYPNLVSIFEVWQYAFASIKNAISDALLDQAAAWRKELSQRSTTRRPPLTPSRWEPLRSELGDFTKSLTQLILRSAEVRPDLTEPYLIQIIESQDLRREKFEEVVVFSPILARSHPDLLVDLTLRHMRRELPDELRERERREFEQSAEWRKRVLVKPPEERTRTDQQIIDGLFSSVGMHSFGHHDWEALAVEDDLSAYFPPSPLREPFRSLFASAPDRALRLLADLSNHAMTAWRQLHRLAREAPGTPIPLDIEFPWGKQQFWGGDREYLWFRGLWGPKPIACGYLTLEEWALGELERGRPVNELIEQIVSGNQCIAVLGVAAAVALQAGAVSDAVFPIVTSQRLLAADHNRMLQDYTSATAGLIGFSGTGDLDHVEAVKRANGRPVRRRELRWLVSLYFLNARFQERTKAAVLDFVNALPFQIEQHRTIAEAQGYLRQQALEYAELVDFENYQRVPAPEGKDRIAIVHVSPTATSPERVARAEEAEIRLREGNLWAWGSKYFETGQLGDLFTVKSGIDFAKSVDSANLFKASESDADMIDMRRGAVAAAAAVALDRRDGASSQDLAWARDVLKRAISAPEKRDICWCPESVIPWHPSIFVARGLAADVRNGTADQEAAYELLALVAHPLEAVSLTALEVALSLWDQDARLGWSSLYLALSLCVLSPPTGATSQADETQSLEKIRSAVNEASRIYRAKDWTDLPQPPAAWVKVEGKGQLLGMWDEFEDHVKSPDVVDSDERWAPSPVHWHDQYAAKVVTRVPLGTILRSPAAPKLLDLLSGQLTWTISKLSPPWVRQGRRDHGEARLLEWTRALGSVVGKVAGLCSLADVEARFLSPIFALEDDHCWKLLAPMVDVFICMHIYDAKEVPADAPALLMRCLDRFLQARAFDPQTYRSGKLYGFDQPRLAKALMFVAIDEPVIGAVRYANGDWSDIGRILPVVDRFVRSAGWISTIMSHFLKFSERAKEVYPAELFADQVLHVIDGGPPLKGWRGTFLPARIAGLVQHFADRETPMSLEVGQKLLRILDLLVDMGDRRSAALQLSESFREIQVRAKNT
jgi:hypothetical protein